MWTLWIIKREAMSKYTKSLTAEQLIQYIAIDRPEMSHDKVKWQRDHYIKICLEWLEENVHNDRTNNL